MCIYDNFCRAQFKYSCGRQSPLWGVQRGALSCGDRPITNQLAKHKEYHKDFVPERPIQVHVGLKSLQE